MQQQVYFYARQPALAILLQQQQPVQEEMRLQCTGPDVTAALRLAHLQMIYVRIVSQAAEQFTYNGVWLITDITEQSAVSTQVDMISMGSLAWPGCIHAAGPSLWDHTDACTPCTSSSSTDCSVDLWNRSLT